jgi:hypothetical protein
MHWGKRGPYRPWQKRDASGFGAFIRARREKRFMTQAQYAKLIGVSLRTLVELEKSESDRVPMYSVVGWGMAQKDFASEFELSAAFADFKEEKSR